MPTFHLFPHPATSTDAVSSIDVALTRLSGKRLGLNFSVRGDLDHILWPFGDRSKREDDLWRHTCFEAFVRGGGLAYYELNLATSHRWAAYRFDSYRDGMREEHAIPDPHIRVRRPEPGRVLTLEATLDLGRVSDFPDWEEWRLGLSAVIEERNGCISYWALAHSEGPPDFHHDACFAASLPPIAHG